MSQRRVFISHSSRENERANAIRHAIRTRLESEPERWAVLMDDLRLDPGDAWRARINLWLGACDAAVVIVGPEALTSAYVAYELNILGYRRWKEDREQREFRIIPVLAGVTMKEVDGSILRPAQASEWMAAIDGDDDACADAVVQALAGIVQACSRPIERRARALMRALPGEEDEIEVAAAALGVRLPFDINESRRLMLAHGLLHAGMSDDAVKALRRIRRNRDLDLATAKELLSSAWVDLKSDDLAALITGTARTPLALNAAFDVTARMYIGAARHLEHPPLECHVTVPNTVIGECQSDASHRDRVVRAVRKALFETLCIEDDAQLQTNLARYHKLREPVIAILHVEAPDRELVSALRAAFPYVTFFLLTGPRGDASRLPAEEVLVIRPPLGEQDEDVCHSQYIEFCELIDLP